jgi:hypothetical protein
VLPYYFWYDLFVCLLISQHEMFHEIVTTESLVLLCTIQARKRGEGREDEFQVTFLYYDRN